MRDLVYSIFLSQYGVTYLDCFLSTDGDIVVYGINKATGEYSFWKVRNTFDLDLIEVVDSKARAYFSYSVLHRGY